MPYISPLPYYAFYPFTPTLNKLYWDAKSQEQIVHDLTKKATNTSEYIDAITTKLNETIEIVNTTLDNFDIRLTAMEKSIIELQNTLENIATAPIAYDPTQGKYTSSKQAMRNIYRDLAIYGARTNQMATLPVATAAQTGTLEMSVIGNYTVFNDTTPRVTPVERNNSNDSTAKHKR